VVATVMVVGPDPVGKIGTSTFPSLSVLPVNAVGPDAELNAPLVADIKMGRPTKGAPVPGN
jgi:hypothetical protein